MSLKQKFISSSFTEFLWKFRTDYTIHTRQKIRSSHLTEEEIAWTSQLLHINADQNVITVTLSDYPSKREKKRETSSFFPSFVDYGDEKSRYVVRSLYLKPTVTRLSVDFIHLPLHYVVVGRREWLQNCRTLLRHGRK